MDFSDYQTNAMRTDSDDYDKPDDRILNALMGLNGEAGEAIDIFKKYRYQGHEFDREKLIEELGDILWYVTLGAKAVGTTLEDVAKKNLRKLDIRYPKGRFDYLDSIQRRDHEKRN